MYTGTLVEFLNMGGGEIMLILAVVLLLFGGKKLPELARGLGKGLREFKDASDGVKREIHRNINSVGINDEINEFKSAFNDEPSNRNHPYDHTPNDGTYTPDPYSGHDEPYSEAANFDKQQAAVHTEDTTKPGTAHSPADSNEHTKTETDKTKIN
ncbi:sec-independent protein translocase protein TatA [Pedobacter africanus]|uniref:Sec-independent protein translocase protein TatA n=1 Tax=Pedobacter africanus TaxID=151894 RepID=A0ACC6L3V9_9SPHI|nr:twin-arginine translocase TatA/TatE family subunit [Pedobacter africanus]MDR6786192.1 sec-independent protein translocase protein TatA [Pedobacter africanus]